jgi:EamA domain-containing membrane protein RarD
MIAGAFVLVSLALGYFVNPLWYLFTAFVGLNLFQSAFTNWCPMMTILQKLGVVSCVHELKTPTGDPRALHRA